MASLGAELFDLSGALLFVLALPNKPKLANGSTLAGAVAVVLGVVAPGLLGWMNAVLAELCSMLNEPNGSNRLLEGAAGCAELPMLIRFRFDGVGCGLGGAEPPIKSNWLLNGSIGSACGVGLFKSSRKSKSLASFCAGCWLVCSGANELSPKSSRVASLTTGSCGFGAGGGGGIGDVDRDELGDEE